MSLSHSRFTLTLLQLSHWSVSRPQPVEKAVPSDWHSQTGGFSSLQCTALISNSQTNFPFISTLFVKAAEGTLHSQAHRKNTQWALKLMSNNCVFLSLHTSQRSALSLKFNFGVYLFQESRIVSQITGIKKKRERLAGFFSLWIY